MTLQLKASVIGSNQLGPCKSGRPALLCSHTQQCWHHLHRVTTSFAYAAYLHCSAACRGDMLRMSFHIPSVPSTWASLGTVLSHHILHHASVSPHHALLHIPQVTGGQPSYSPQVTGGYSAPSYSAQSTGQQYSGHLPPSYSPQVTGQYAQQAGPQYGQPAGVAYGQQRAPGALLVVVHRFGWRKLALLCERHSTARAAPDRKPLGDGGWASADDELVSQACVVCVCLMPARVCACHIASCSCLRSNFCVLAQHVQHYRPCQVLPSPSIHHFEPHCLGKLAEALHQHVLDLNLFHHRLCHCGQRMSCVLAFPTVPILCSRPTSLPSSQHCGHDAVSVSICEPGHRPGRRGQGAMTQGQRHGGDIKCG